VVDARAGVEGVTHYLIGTGHSQAREFLAGHVVGQGHFGEDLAGDAEHRRGGRPVGVVVEETRVDDRRVLRQPAAEVD
jgi:hypothetical protein